MSDGIAFRFYSHAIRPECRRIKIAAMRPDVVHMTRRERDVLVELCRPSLVPAPFVEPATTRAIAEALFVTEAAVKQHLIRLYDRFELHQGGDNRRLQLANLALERGIVSRADLGAPDRGSAAAPPPPLSAAPERIRNGRLALARRDWRAAFEALAAADADGDLTSAEDVAALGEAAYWAGEARISQDARHRAYGLQLSAGDERSAAMIALGLVINYASRLKFAVAAGWLAKARRHVETFPEGREHALVAAIEGMVLILGGDLDAGELRTHAAIALGRQYADRDAVAIGLAFRGCVLVHRGQLAEARALLDEAMAAATAGELGPLATGLVYCRTITACLDMFDFRRAFEWTQAVEETERRIAVGGVPGDCRAHRATVLAMHGEWASAEEEARLACQESEPFDLTHTGIATYELGELRLRAGDLDAADNAFRRATDFGHRGEPGTSLCSLARGRLDSARSSIAAALSEAQGNPLARARLLPAAVEIAVAAGDDERVQRFATEIATIALDLGSSTLEAHAAHARGCAALMRGDVGGAIQALHLALRIFMEVEAPYLAARVRFDLGRTLLAKQQVDIAIAEIQAARLVFERVGARPDAQRSADFLVEMTSGPPTLPAGKDAP